MSVESANNRSNKQNVALILQLKASLLAIFVGSIGLSTPFFCAIMMFLVVRSFSFVQKDSVVFFLLKYYDTFEKKNNIVKFPNTM